jgi:hypothetical protein
VLAGPRPSPCADYLWAGRAGSQDCRQQAAVADVSDGDCFPGDVTMKPGDIVWRVEPYPFPSVHQYTVVGVTFNNVTLKTKNGERKRSPFTALVSTQGRTFVSPEKNLNGKRRSYGGGIK